MKKYVLAALLALTSLNAMAEKWVEVLKDDPVFLYADIDSIHQDRNITKMKVRMEIPGMDIVNVNEQEFDCAKRKVRDSASKKWTLMGESVAAKKCWVIACKKE